MVTHITGWLHDLQPVMTPSYTFASIANPYDATVMRSNPLALVLPLLQCMPPIQDEEGVMAYVR
jgi:hypothetical protein